MAIGGFNAGTWDETVPAGAESVGLGYARIESVKSTVRQGLDSEHVWAASGGTIGQHRAGSARAFYGPQSQVSASNSASTTSVVDDGRMMVTSDTSRLFGVNSLGTVLLGPGPLGLSVGSYTPVSFPQRLYVATEVGFDFSATSAHSVAFASAFSAAPFVQVSASTVASAASNPLDIKLLALTTTGFQCHLVDSTSGAGVFGAVQWFAVGHRAL